MSDYLWDRTGERDAEVERLETLLGAYAHKARPLELPAEEAIAAAPRAPRPLSFTRRPFASRLFAPAGLAAAAALALAVALWIGLGVPADAEAYSLADAVQSTGVPETLLAGADGASTDAMLAAIVGER